jgi:effector-binding domain-containing protein
MKLKISIFSLLFISILLFVFRIIPVTEKKVFDLNINFDNYTSFVSQPSNWEKWLPEKVNPEVFKNNNILLPVSSVVALKKDFTIKAASENYSIHPLNPLSYTVTGSNKKNGTVLFSFAYLPDTSLNQIKVEVIEQSNFLSYLFPFLKLNHNGVAAIERLKHYIETPELFYGYPIEKVEVQDTVYVTSSFESTNSKFFNQLPTAFDSLKTFIASRKLHITGNFSVTFNQLNNDSVRVFTGIPVNKLADNSIAVSCLQMPHHGKLVKALFKGKFTDRIKLYSILKKYLLDNHFELVANPYEQYENNQLPVNDNSLINMTLFFPVR